MSKTRTKPKAAETPEPESVIEFCYAEHLSGDELKDKHPKGVDATIVQVAIESVFDSQINDSKRLPVIGLDLFTRSLIVNKTNLRFLRDTFGKDDSQWIGKRVHLSHAKRSNGKLGIDLDEAEE
jgi:hypothetical protein